MNRYIRNVIHLPSLISSFVRHANRQKKYLLKTVSADIEEIKQGADESLTEKDIKKIFSYYGSAVTAFLGESFCVLRGAQMTGSERFALTYLGAMTGLFDDFFDQKDTPHEHILEMIRDPSEKMAKNSHERLFLRFCLRALSETDPERLKRNAAKVFDDQILSLEQQSPDITQERLQFITWEKGGDSILFYRSVFDSPLEDDERAMLYSMGAVGQFANDLFDIYDDYQDHILTLATTATSINELRGLYQKMTRQTFVLIDQTHFSPKYKRHFTRYFSLIACRAMVALDFLEQNERHTQGIFSVGQYARKDLVCDMGSVKNLLKLAHYYAKLTP